MKFASSKVLGIAVTDRAIACAQITGRGSHAAVRHAATFTLPDGMSLDKPEAVGAALGAFLKQQDFDASHVVVGVPAKWVIAVEKDVPPAGREQMKALLRLQAERLPLAEGGELVFDYVGEHASDKAGKVLLVAMLRKQLDRLEKVMESAGLSIAAVTPTSLVLANASAIGNGAASRANVPMLMLGRHGAEVVWQRQGTPRMLKHFGVTATNGHGTPALGPLGTELRRVVATSASSADASSTGAPAAGEMVLWDSVGLEPSQVNELSERLGVRVHSDDGLKMLGVRGPDKAPTGDEDLRPGHYAPALALALAGADRSLLPFNFVKSRLAAPPVRRFGRRAVWATVIGSLFVIGLGWLIADVKLIKQSVLDDIAQQRKAHSKPLEAALDVKGRVDISNDYLSKRMQMLDALRAITLDFGQEDPMWVSSFSIDEEREGKDAGKAKVKLEGRTTNQSMPLQLAERLRHDPKFSTVSSPAISGTGGGSGPRGQRGEPTWTFTISFLYSPNNTTSESSTKAAAPQK